LEDRIRQQRPHRKIGFELENLGEYEVYLNGFMVHPGWETCQAVNQEDGRHILIGNPTEKKSRDTISLKAKKFSVSKKTYFRSRT
jgi:hypothetical protein